MDRQKLSENLFGKIMGKILEGQTKQVVKLIQKDSELVAQTKKVDDAVKALKKALEKSSCSHKELFKKYGL